MITERVIKKAVYKAHSVRLIAIKITTGGMIDTVYQVCKYKWNARTATHNPIDKTEALTMYFDLVDIGIRQGLKYERASV